jgi:hypothetical protein
MDRKQEKSLNIESLSYKEKTEFLARLAYLLTICSRDTYEAGTNRVLGPEVLRAYNELLHRVTAAVAQHVTGDTAFPPERILKMMQVFGEANNRPNEMRWALEQATKKRSQSRTKLHWAVVDL